MRKLIVLTEAVLRMAFAKAADATPAGLTDAIPVEDAAAVTFGGTLQELAITNVPMRQR